jgi:endonuclease/exonuclease/phosphatase family metal-dependent hydrolase
MKNAVAFCLAAFLWFSCSKEAPVQPESPVSTFLPPSALDTTITLVSFNMAVGFDAEAMLAKDLSNPRIVLDQGKALYAGFLDSRPRQRILALADSLVRIAPDVIGLQEVLYLVNRQDSQTYDFLPSLLAAMDSLGGPSYAAVRQVLNPIPITVKVSDGVGQDSLDIYFHEGNALLYKTASLSLVSSDSLKFFLGIRNQPYLSSTLSILRGAVLAKLRTSRGTLLNVINTHLEVDAVPGIGSGQAEELQIYVRNLSLSREAVAVLGDFNGPPDGRRVAMFLSENFADTYSGLPGSTCCYEIADPAVAASRRIDFILARSIVKIETAWIGLDGTFTADSGAYRISDHAGVFAGLTFH